MMGMLLSAASCQTGTSTSAASGQATTASSPAAAPAASAFENIPAAAFAEKMKMPNTVVLDVRTPAETAAGKIDGAIEMDVNAPDFAQQLSQLDKSKTYLVYCRSGRRSAVACNIMSGQGFTQLFNLEGGYLSWPK